MRRRNRLRRITHPIRMHSTEHETVRRGKSVGQGGMVTMLGKRDYRVGSCSGAAITTLDRQALCLNHFLLRCYEKLEGFDPRGRKFSAEPVDLVAMRAFVEECSRKALDVSLQSENLSNLQRGRLLDILLWAGELFLLLRAPRLTLVQSTVSSERDRKSTRLNSSHVSISYAVFCLKKKKALPSLSTGLSDA